MTGSTSGLSDQELLLIGRIHAAHTMIDDLMAFTLRVLVGARPEPARPLMSRLSFDDKIRLLRELGVSRLRNNVRLTGMSDLLVRVEEAGIKSRCLRFRITLPPRAEGEDNGKGITVDPQATDIVALEHLAVEIETAATDVLRFLNKVHGELYNISGAHDRREEP